MKRAVQVETLRALLELRKQGRDQMAHEGGGVMHLPVRNYTDDSVLADEMKTVFRDFPMVAGHATHVREPGQYLLSDWDSFPFVVVRDEEGVLRAFLNHCRHRGARLLSEVGEKRLKAFVCPFHGWAYGLDGKLKAVTKSYNFPDLDLSTRSLVALTVVERDGLIWVHPTPGAPIDLDTYLGHIGEDLEHFGVDELVTFRKNKVVKNANWKLLLKTYLEGYHVPYLHRSSIAKVFHKGVIAHHEHGPHIRLSAARNNLLDVLEEAEEGWQILKYASVYYTLFPCTFFIMHPDYVSINAFYPLAPDRTLWTHEMLYKPANFVGEKGQQALAKRFDYTNDIVFDLEDFMVAEDVQIGLRPQDDHVLGLEERLLQVFQTSVDDAIAQRP